MQCELSDGLERRTETDRRLSKLWERPRLIWIWVAAPVFVTLWWVGNRVYFPEDYDDGVYLASAWALASGHHLYSDIFFGQPPLWIALTRFGLSWFGPGETGTRIVMLFFSLLSLVGIGLIAYRLFGGRGILLAAGLQAIQLSRFGALWNLQAEVPAMAFALLAVGLAVSPHARGEFILPQKNTENTKRGVLSSLRSLCSFAANGFGLRGPYARMMCVGMLFAMAMLCKVWVLPFVIPILLSPLIPGRALHDSTLHASRSTLHAPLPALDARPLTLEFVKSGITAAIAGGITVAVVLSFYDLRLVYAQAVQFHMDARDTFGGGLMRNVHVLSDYLTVFGGIAALAVFGAFLAPANRSIWILAWGLACVAFLLAHRPLFDHHVLLVVPVLSLWACAGALTLMDNVRGLSVAVSKVMKPVIIVAVLGMATFNFAAPGAARFEIIKNTSRDEMSVRDREAIEIIQKLTGGNERVGGDDQGLVFRAERMSPPELCDTSFVRIRSGYLRLAEAVAAASKCKVIVLGTGRLQQLPGFREWLETRFELAAEVNGRLIFVRSIPV